MDDTAYLFSPAVVRGLRGRVDSLLRRDSLLTRKADRLEESLLLCQTGRAAQQQLMAVQDTLLDDYKDFRPSLLDDIGVLGLAVTGGYAVCQATN